MDGVHYWKADMLLKDCKDARLWVNNKKIKNNLWKPAGIILALISYKIVNANPHKQHMHAHYNNFSLRIHDTFNSNAFNYKKGYKMFFSFSSDEFCVFGTDFGVETALYK